MKQQIVGILHPGSMGAAVASCASAGAASVLWCPTGRSEATAARARRFGLVAVSTLRELVARSGVLISLCPPAAAEEVAREVAQLGFVGVYVEANAVTPERVQRIASLLATATTVDAAVIGSPPVDGKRPCLYLSGPAAETALIEGLFAATAVSTRVLGTEIGPASALKLAYTAFQKTSRTLAALSIGIARVHGVDRELIDIAGTRTDSYLSEPAYIPKVAARAWRWAPELDEVADMLAASGMPDEMLRAAARTLEKWDDAKDEELTIAEALARLIQP